MNLRKLKGLFFDNRGFTIGEMLAVTVIIGIMSAIAIPSYLSMQPAMRLNGAAREVFGKLMWARAQAVEENQSYVVLFPNNHTVTVLKDLDGDEVADAGEPVETYDIQDFYSDCTFTVSGDTTPNFSSRGTATSATTITVSNTVGTRAVSVSVTGNIKIN
jgi:type IV fimbrial biogenesis protein FimT